MPNLTDYSLADINKFSLLSDFPEDFKNACSSAELDLSIKFSDVNADTCADFPRPLCLFHRLYLVCRS